MFTKFSKAVNAKFSKMTGPLLYTGEDNRTLEQVYIDAFPEGTNLIYKVKREYECACCYNFIRNIGNVVSIEDGKLTTVWDVEGLPEPFQTVANALAAHVKSQPIQGLWVTKEKSYGAETTKSMVDGSVKKWDHFWGVVPKAAYSTEPGKVAGEFNSLHGVFLRGLNEFTQEALDTVYELIEGKALYRGDEFKKAVAEFRALKGVYDATEDKALWAYSVATNQKSFRNTAIGTLVTDLSEGMDVEKAVGSFEAKVAPTNYKRPTSFITQSMVKDAMLAITNLGLEDALQRRFARISDVSVNNVLWVNNASKANMKSSLENLLMTVVVKKAPKKLNSSDISIDEFMESVLPTASAMEVLVKNAHSPNFVSLTAPVHADAKGLFRWDNSFAWSYSGNIADSDMRQKVVQRGGSVSGVFRFTHMWNYGKRNASLMDLHVFEPGSKQNRTVTGGMEVHYHYGTQTCDSHRVGWNNRQNKKSLGIQDVDYTAPAPEGYVPVENITYPLLDKMTEGVYTCRIHNWQLRSPTQGGFKAEIEVGGVVYEYEWDKPLANMEWLTVAEVTLKGGKFTVDHKIPCGQVGRQVWGVQTESFVPVSTVMFSPNYWDGNAVGNKHWFFILENCLNPDATRGIYNEFLASGLEKHRKVFETIGSKTKCQPSEQQLSGLGFSSTTGATVTVKVTGDKGAQTFNITF